MKPCTFFVKSFGFFFVLAALVLVPVAASDAAKSQTSPANESAPDGLPESFAGKLSLYVLTGQSNMSGRGQVPDTLKPASRIYVFGNDYRWRQAQEPVDSPAGQVDLVSVDSLAGYSPALSFARSLLAADPDQIIGLIPCAKGATSIHRWQRHLSDQTLYGSCLKRLRAASVVGEIKGVLFYQGEADALDPAKFPDRKLSAYDWKDRFTAFIWALRADVAQPDLPIVFAQLGTTTRPDIYPFWQEVKDQQKSVNLPDVGMVMTEDLELSDYVHLTTAAYQTLGERFARAMMSLAQNK